MKSTEDISNDSGRPASHGAKGKRTIAVILIAALAVIASGYLVIHLVGQGRSQAVSEQHVTKYHCPMHPQIVRDKPGSCPICGMDLVPMVQQDEPAIATPKEDTTFPPNAKKDEAAKYYCPMHPQVIQDKPGSCPICGMDLVLMEKHDSHSGAVGQDKSDVAGYASVTIDSDKRNRMGLRLGVVGQRDLVGEVRTSAKILVDETRQVGISTKIEGWVGQLFVATTGQPVKKGDPLLTIYSPQLVSAQEEYLSALATQADLATSSQDTREGASRLVKAARNRLELWDISEKQIKRLEETKQVEKFMTLYAPSGGWMTERMVLSGQKVTPGEQLLVIVDLSKVWADADIYQSDLPHVQIGMDAELSLPSWPGKVIRGKVSFVTPTLDPETRTMRARIEVDNQELLLKPGMYATAHLEHGIGQKLAIPVTAVMFTGDRTLAFREGIEQRLVPVEIQLGMRSGDYFEVLSGLREGDSVVTSANFLVDSESSLEAAQAALTGENTAASSEHSSY